MKRHNKVSERHDRGIGIIRIAMKTLTYVQRTLTDKEGCRQGQTGRASGERKSYHRHTLDRNTVTGLGMAVTGLGMAGRAQHGGEGSAWQGTTAIPGLRGQM